MQAAAGVGWQHRPGGNKLKGRQEGGQHAASGRHGRQLRRRFHPTLQELCARAPPPPPPLIKVKHRGQHSGEDRQLYGAPELEAWMAGLLPPSR